MMMMQKEGTLERSKTKEKDCCGEIRDSDEELETVHGEPNHHRGEWEVEETSHASAQRESGTLVSAPKEAFRTKQQYQQ